MKVTPRVKRRLHVLDICRPTKMLDSSNLGNSADTDGFKFVHNICSHLSTSNGPNHAQEIPIICKVQMKDPRSST